MERLPGVTWDKVAKKWKVRYGQTYITLCETLEEANEVRRQVCERLGVPVIRNTSLEHRLDALVAGRKTQEKAE